MTMQSMLRRHLLALMLGVTTVAFSTTFLLDVSASAKNGSDDHGSDDSGGDDGGSSGSGSDDSGSDDSGNDTSDSDSDDSSGSDDLDDIGSDDNSSGGDKSSKKKDMDTSQSNARPTATITLTPESLSQVRAGTHQVVDQLGRQLEIRVTNVSGVQVVRAKPHGGDARRWPGPITTINVVPNAAAPGNDDGTPDQGSGDH